MNAIQTTQRVTFTSIATILIPLGVGIINSNLWGGVTLVALGVLALVVRELFKSE